MKRANHEPGFSSMLKTKCVYSPISHTGDGLRILVTRFRGRGMKRSRYHVWMANLGPTESLLRKVNDGRLSWSAFSREYKKQLFSAAMLDKENRTIKNRGQKFTLRLIKQLSRKGNVTLMCHCGQDESQCHRHLLKQVIQSNMI